MKVVGKLYVVWYRIKLASIGNSYGQRLGCLLQKKRTTRPCLRDKAKKVRQVQDGDRVKVDVEPMSYRNLSPAVMGALVTPNRGDLENP